MSDQAQVVVLPAQTQLNNGIVKESSAVLEIAAAGSFTLRFQELWEVMKQNGL